MAANKQSARAFRLGAETDADLDYLATRLRTTQTAVIRELVRVRAAAERKAEKKSGGNPPLSIDSSNTQS